MSTAPEDPELVSLTSALGVVVRSQIGVVALLVYEYAITFDQEVALFWKRKKTGATWLFFTTRYLALLTFSFLGAATFAPMSNRGCQTLQVIQFSAQTLQYLPWAAFSGLRALVMSGMNWWLASSVCILASALSAGNVWGLSVGISGSVQPPFGCGGGNLATPRQDLIVTAVGRSCIIAADIIVIILTWRYSIKSRGPHSLRGVRSHFADTLMINGTVYFLVFITLNIILLTFTLISTIYALDTVGTVITFVDPLQAIMVCRFMLSLQAANNRALGREFASDAGGDGTHGTPYDEQTLRFASLVVGSIGAELTISEPEDDDRVGDAGRTNDVDVHAAALSGALSVPGDSSGKAEEPDSSAV